MHVYVFISENDRDEFVAYFTHQLHIENVKTHYISLNFFLIRFYIGEKRYQFGCTAIKENDNAAFATLLHRFVATTNKWFGKTCFLLIAPYAVEQFHRVNDDAYRIHKAVKWEQGTITLNVCNDEVKKMFSFFMNSL